MPVTDQDSDVIDGTTRVLQVITFAMTTGLVMFLGVILFLGPGKGQGKRAGAPGADTGQPQEQGPVLPVLSVAALTLAVAVVPLSVVVPGLVVDSARKRIAAGTWTPGKLPEGESAPSTDVARLAAVYQLKQILGAALTEGPAFFALIAYMLEGTTIALGLSLLLIVGVALRFPQRARVAQWIDAQLDRLILDRQAV